MNLSRARVLLRTAFALLFLLIGALTAFAQTQNTQASTKAPVMTLDYFDNDQQITVTNKDGMAYQFVNIGMQLTPGDRVTTKSSTAELRLDPNGTIVKLAPYTSFSVNSVEGQGQSKTNSFTLNSGTLHAVVARITGANYQFHTNSAVGGIRGTDFGMLVIPGKADQLFVKEGLVEFQKNGGQTIQVGTGQFADALAPTFQAVSLSGAQLASLFKDLDFTKLDPTKVPGQQPAQVASNTTNETPEQPKQAEAPKPSSGGGSSFLADFLSLEIGGVTIDGVTYSKVVLSPHFQIGKLQAALYLPVIYSSNLLDPTDWYRPRGNNEWSFGFDQPTLWDGTKDFLTDLVLKIRYIEWGKQRDPFFFKIGNLHDMTIGHGVIMRNFANDADFPAVRRVGLNLGIDFKAAGFESVVNDLANPQIFGGRLYFRPLGKTFPLALGVSAVSDIAPASEVPSSMPAGTPASTVQAYADAVAANPLILTVGADLDFPVVESDKLAVILFGDVAGLFPYLRNSVSGLSSGFHTDAVFYKDPAGKQSLRNYAAATGVMGNIWGLNYRLEYRNYNGVMRPGLFDTVYERLRGQYAADLMTYLENPTDSQYNQVTMGIYGEAGFTLLSALDFEAGYFWPWTWDSAGNLQFGENDYLKLMLAIHKKKLPLGIYGSISYERTKFVPTLLGKSTTYGKLQLFDANTAVVGELVYPIAPPLDLMLRVTTTVLHDSAGNVVYDDNGNPKFMPSVSIETRIGF